MRSSDLVRRGLDDLSQARSGSGRVLVVEDEAGILETTVEMLDHLGYEVCPVQLIRWADEAIAIAREFQPHVALLGYIMPWVGGARLGMELSRFLPKTKIVLSVEAVGAAEMDQLRRDGYDFATLPAPYSLGELRKKIPSWLAESAQRG